ncbi:MAG: hypothetical protein C0483_21365 [Pirellula sp.]|nr:hypothetical protein [Pirellula sp.]
MVLTDTQIKLLLRQQSISDRWPWSTNDESVIDKNIKDIVVEVCRQASVEDKTEYGHYGSGYASFVDCWLYRPNDTFRIRSGNNFQGLVVVFSRLSPFYVLGEGAKSWHERGGGSYLPCFDFVDEIKHQAVSELIPQVTAVLADRGLERLHKSDLDVVLPTSVRVPTILADHENRHFDALFYWED